MTESIVVKEKELLSTKRITISQLLDKANDIQSKCSDYYITGANENNLRIDEMGGVTYQEDNGEVRSKYITRHALGQLCSKIGVPSQYLEKCINTGRLELAQENLSSWISDYNGNLFIREYDDSIRGVLSHKFATCDTPEILEVLNETLSKNTIVKGYYMSPERFHLRVIDRGVLPVDTEDLFSGLTIDSSDVGRSTLSVRFLLYKKVCSNGLCLPQRQGDIFQQKHIGITAEALREGLKQNIELVPELTKEVIKNIEIARNSGIVVRDFDNDAEIEEILNRLRNTLKMSEEQASKVINLFEYRVHKAEDFRYENNNWGLINAITEISKDATLERRIELERLAGSLLVA